MEIKPIQQVLKESGVYEHVLENLLHPDGIEGNCFERIIKAMEIYAKQISEAACKEQKILCDISAVAYLDVNDNPIVSSGSILNTPIPTEYINSIIK